MSCGARCGDSEDRADATGAPRRAVLAMGAAATAGALAGCAVYGRQPAPPPDVPPATGSGGPTGGDGATASGEPGDSGGSGDSGDSGDSGGGAAAGVVLAGTADVPAGGGLVVAGREVVVTQPADGEFRGFSAICTHQGCTVASVSDGTINCPCHGSRFSIEDGSVVQAAAGLTPAQQRPLPEVAIRVDGDEIVRP